MASIGISGSPKDLGDVADEESNKDAGLFSIPVPLADSDESLVQDLFGTIREITVTGVKTGTIAELRTFVTNIETLEDGEQSVMVFISSWTNSNKNVFIKSFHHSKGAGDESKVNYTLNLIETQV